MKKLFLGVLLLLSISSLFAKGPFQRIEPANWWIGMQNETLQVLFYGENVSTLRPSIAYEGVTIDRIVTTTNPNYLFLYLNIDSTTKAGEVPIVFKSGKKVKATINYPLLEREPGSAMREGFNSSDVIYLLMPDRFANSIPENDATALTAELPDRADMNGRHGGDFQGITDHLDYLADMGVTAIWNTPSFMDNMPRYSYHGYAISDYYQMDPRFGGNEGYRNLCREAEKRGIKMIIDFVTNHCATTHWWMEDLPSEDWIHQFDTFTRCNFRATTVADPHAAAADLNLNNNGWFDTSMVDLNQTNPQLLDYITQSCIWWIEYAGLKGVRIDTYLYNDKYGMAEFCSRIMKEYPKMNIVGECWMHKTSEVAYWQKDALNRDGFNSELPTVMDFPLIEALNVAIQESDAQWDGGMMRVYEVLTQDYLYADLDNLMIFLENHDTHRQFEDLDNNIPKYNLMMTLLSTMRGIPQIYYGTEVMMRGVKEQGDGFIRQDFLGGWAGDARNAFTAEGRTEDENKVFNFTRKMLNWRKNKAVIHTGKLLHFAPEHNVYVYFRYNESDRVMVILNNSNESRTIELARFAEGLAGAKEGYDVISETTVSLENAIQMAPLSSMVIELK